MGVLKFLRGKKTYILVGAALVVAAGHMVGLLDVDSTNTALAVLGFGSIATLRAGIVAALAASKGETPES